MAVAGAFVFQQAIPINIQKKIILPQFHKGKREGKIDYGIDKRGGGQPLLKVHSLEPQINRPISAYKGPTSFKSSQPKRLLSCFILHLNPKQLSQVFENPFCKH